MAVDREFESLLEAWTEEGWRQHQDELAEQGRARADRWARMTKFVPYSSMPQEADDAGSNA